MPDWKSLARHFAATAVISHLSSMVSVVRFALSTLSVLEKSKSAAIKSADFGLIRTDSNGLMYVNKPAFWHVN